MDACTVEVERGLARLDNIILSIISSKSWHNARIFLKKGMFKLHVTRAQLKCHMYANGIEFINFKMASSSSTCITSSEGPKSTGINWEQESASI